MNLHEMIGEISDMELYASDEWDEYLDCFEEADGLRAYLARRTCAAGGELASRIRSGLGRVLDANIACDSPKVVTAAQLADRDAGEAAPLGVVSGCFDLLHLGHLRGIRYAKQRVSKHARGAICALLLSDGDIRAKKGLARPIMDINERLEMLAGVRFVDYVIVLEQPDCLAALEQLRPHLFFKSRGDASQPLVRREIALVERLGGHVEFFPAESGQGMSTTALARTVREQSSEE